MDSTQGFLIMISPSKGSTGLREKEISILFCLERLQGSGTACIVSKTQRTA
jgi:hypothetical protein